MSLATLLLIERLISSMLISINDTNNVGHSSGKFI